MKEYAKKCAICGTEFKTSSVRAKYCCDYCRMKAQSKRNRNYLKNKESGNSVKIGSEKICPICHKPFTVTSGFQKYCKDCTKKATKKSQPSSEYIKEKYDYIRINLPKGEGESIKNYAKSLNMTVKQLILTALDEYKINHKDEKTDENQ